MKTNVCRLMVARTFRRSNVLCRQEFQNRAMIIKTLLNQLVRSVLGKYSGSVRKLAKKEHDQYFPRTDLTLVR